MNFAGEMRKWSVHDDGTSEAGWLCGIPWSDLGRLDLDALCARWRRIIVISAHPDDETLAVGAFIADLAARGMKVEVLVLTDGECSHGDSRTLRSEVVRAVRCAELEDALTELGVSAMAQQCHLPDGGLAANTVDLQSIFADAFTSDDSTLVLAPHPCDGHADHDIAGKVAAEVADNLGVDCVHYPLWLWHWCSPTEVEWDRAVAVAPSVEALNRKRQALCCYPSQTGMFGRQNRTEPVLPARVLAHFERIVEVFFDPRGVLPAAQTDSGLTPAGSFDAMFAESDDPWGVESRWYERRKRALVMAMLPHENLGRVLDLGCSIGALTQLLAARATSVIGVDGSEEALKRARTRRLDGGSDIEWRQGLVPEALSTIEGAFDTIVISEIGYFLDGVTLLELFSAVTGLLADDGIVVCVNWQHPTKNIPLDGTYVDRAARSAWQTIAHYEDDDVAITIGTKVAR